MKSKIDLVIMDWGIGGLSVYNEIHRRMPGLSILYYSDSGKTPYGKMSAKELQSRLRHLIARFEEQDIFHFIIACNAASTVLPQLKKEFSERGLFVTGVIDHGVELVRSSRKNRIGVIGGRRTILSRSYVTPFQNSKIKVTGRIAQPLSALIERGELQTKLMQDTLKNILQPLKSCNALVLACTHYPAVSDQIQNILPECHLLDPAAATADYVKKSWRLRRKNKTAKVRRLFMTSGNADEMKKSAFLAFSVKIPKILSCTLLNIE